MQTPDVNVLVSAHRVESAVHGVCRQWLETAINGPEQLALTAHALAGFVRIVTNRRVFVVPTPRSTAFAVCAELLGHPNVMPVAPGPAFWGLFRAVCDEANLMGPDISDGYLAALAIEHNLDASQRTGASAGSPGCG